VTGAPADGLSRPYVAAVAIGSAVYGFLAIWLSLALTQRLIGDGLPAAAAVWLGTPLLFYMYVTPVFAHACSAFAVALLLWTWVSIRDRWTPAGAVALGLAGGLVAIVRAQDALFIAGPALDFLRFAWRQRMPQSRPSSDRSLVSLLVTAAAGAAGFAIVLLPQLLAFKALNGHYRQSEYEMRKMTWTSPHGLQVLFDHEHGLFFWTPLALVAAVTLLAAVLRPPRTARLSQPELRWVAVLSLVMIALQAYIAGAVESWTVAGAFGQRRFVSITPVVVLGLAPLFLNGRRPAARRAAVLLVAVCVWWNLGLMAQFGLHTMDRERLTLRANARQSFVELPLRAPRLAWRYLTDRSSFYNQPRQ
jgi:hypothetical protein